MRRPILTKAFYFYRFDDWIYHMGVPLVLILSASAVRPLLALTGLVQVFLLLMFVFSLNDVLDAFFWEEDNWAIRVYEKDRGEALVLLSAPLLSMFSLAFINGETFFIAFLVALSVLYDFFPRLKIHYIFSVLINVFGFVLAYFYPYLVMGGMVGFIQVYLLILFGLYMFFFEAVHQLSDVKENRVSTIGSVLGRNLVLRILRYVFLAPAILSLAAFLFYRSNPIFLGGLLFNVLRLIVFDPELYYREQWHRFYIFYEGFFYVLVLVIAAI